MIEKETFDLKLAIQCADSFSQVCGVGCVLTDAAGRVLHGTGCNCANCGICRAACRGEEDCSQSQLYGMAEAERFGGKYIYFCPMGLTCFVSPIFDNERSVARITVGPFLMVDRQDFIICDLMDQMHLSGKQLEDVTRLLQQVPYIPADRVGAMSLLLFLSVGFINNTAAANRMLESQASTAIQGHITAYIEQVKASEHTPPYPFDTEKELLQAVRQSNKQDAQKHLNDLLGYILLASGGNFAQCKTRVYELLVLISRAAIEAGANPEETLKVNHTYMTEITRLQNFDDLCAWLVRVTAGLMDSIFDFEGLHHAHIVHRSIQYISSHYAEKLTLDSVAYQVHLSPTYFSRIFKEETGESLTSYINRIRIDHSKELLLHQNLQLAEIALLVGFEEQSYFTKVFKKMVGVSPLRYRAANGKMQNSGN